MLLEWASISAEDDGRPGDETESLLRDVIDDDGVDLGRFLQLFLASRIPASSPGPRHI